MVGSVFQKFVCFQKSLVGDRVIFERGYARGLMHEGVIHEGLYTRGYTHTQWGYENMQNFFYTRMF